MTTSSEATVEPLLNDRPHTLYRMFDADDRLLYVGITVDVPDRFQVHQQDKDWWRDVVTIRLEHYPNRLAALRAERAAIGSENPVHNVSRGQGAGKTPIRSLRAPDEIWSEFSAATEGMGTDVTAALLGFVDWYIHRPGATLPARPSSPPTEDQVAAWWVKHEARKRRRKPTADEDAEAPATDQP